MIRTPPPRWPQGSEPLPEFTFDVPPGDSLHRIACRNATQMLIDADSGMVMPAVFLRWAWGIWACVDRVPEA